MSHRVRHQVRFGQSGRRGRPSGKRPVAMAHLGYCITSPAKGTRGRCSYGMKQRIEIPLGSAIGQTTACPARFGSVTSASSGTSIH
jgi:hypothetical protein